MSHLVHLLVIIVVSFNSNEIHCGVLNKSLTGESSMVRQGVDSLDASTKINSTLPFVLRTNGNSIEAAAGIKSDKVRRQSKFWKVPFLAGFGIGSLANSAQDDLNSLSAKNTISSLHLAKVPSTSNLFSNPPDHSQPPSIYDPRYPNYIALSTYNLLSQSLQPITEILRNLAPSNKRPIVSTIEPIDSTDDINDQEESTQIRYFRPQTNETSIIDSLTLKDLIRAEILQELRNNEARQAAQMSRQNSTERPSNHTENHEKVTTETSSPTSSPMSTTTSKFPGHYSGNGQNISHVDLSSSYGPPEYHRPIYSHPYYGVPPPYAPEPIRSEYYEPYEVYPPGPFGNNFGGVGDQWPEYYARGRKLSSINNNKVLISGSGFEPSKPVRHA